MKAMKKNYDIASYVLKYISKTLKDCQYIQKGKKFYITSMSLKKPEFSYLTEDEAEEYLNNHQNYAKLFELDFNSLYVGDVHYTKTYKPMVYTWKVKHKFL